MSHTKFTWTNGDVPVAGTVGTKGINNLEEQYERMFADLSAYLAANNIASVHTTGLGTFDGGIKVGSNWIVTPNGYIKADKNIMFSAWASGAALSTSTTKLAFGNEYYDLTSVYDKTTTYRFTAPIAGYYHYDVFLQIYMGATAGTCRLGLYHSSSSALVRFTDGYGVASEMLSLHISGTILMSAGSYLEVHGHGPTGAAINGGNGFDVYLVSEVY